MISWRNLVLIAVILLNGFGSQAARLATVEPNIVLLVTDDQRFADGFENGDLAAWRVAE